MGRPRINYFSGIFHDFFLPQTSSKNDMGKYDGQACPAIVFSHMVCWRYNKPKHHLIITDLLMERNPHLINTNHIIEGSLEVKLPTIWTDEKQSRAEGERRERLEERRSEKRKSQKKEDADARKGRKVAKHYVFPMICGSGGSKSRLAKAAGAEPAGQMRDEKLHAVVARSTFPSQNVQNTPGSDHFWKLRCRKSARRCGAKHISKSKCPKHTRLRCRKSARRCGAKHISKSKCPKHLSFGPLLEVEMSKKCTPLWREAHFQVKSVKNWRSRTTFGS